MKNFWVLTKRGLITWKVLIKFFWIHFEANKRYIALSKLALTVVAFITNMNYNFLTGQANVEMANSDLMISFFFLMII